MLTLLYQIVAEVSLGIIMNIFKLFISWILITTLCRKLDNLNSWLEEDLLETYNTIRLLGILYNFCLQAVYIPTQVSAACSVIIIGLYTSVKLHSAIPMPGFAFFPLLAMDGFAMIFITRVGSEVVTCSKRFVQATRSCGEYGRSKEFRKRVAALDVIKVKFGGSNYIDSLTPLVLLHFCITETVSLILLS